MAESTRAGRAKRTGGRVGRGAPRGRPPVISQRLTSHCDIVSAAKQQLPNLGTVYQIYPDSFADGNGDGRGDLIGAAEKLDYIKSLGVDVLWVSPFYPSGGKDGGYDVVDYMAVAEHYGGIEAFRNFANGAHERGMRVIVDLVPSHSSDQHEFFEISADPTHPDWQQHKDDYVWVGPADASHYPPGTPPSERYPTNWHRAFAPPGSLEHPPTADSSVWTWNPAREEFYLHMFHKEQPNWNLDSPNYQAYMRQVIKFWIDNGADGLRVDVPHCGIGRNWFDKPWEQMQEGPDQNRLPRSDTHYVESETAKLTDLIETAVFENGGTNLVYETNIRDELGNYRPEFVAKLLEAGRALGFDFATAEMRSGEDFARVFEAWLLQCAASYGSGQIDPKQPPPIPSVAGSTNHDKDRPVTRKGGLSNAMSTIALFASARGAASFFGGEETGAPDIRVAHPRDAGGRDKNRYHTIWDGQAPHYGWSNPDPEGRPLAPYMSHLSIAEQDGVRGSYLEAFRDLLRALNDSPALNLGSQEALHFDDRSMTGLRRVWESGTESDERVVILNGASATKRTEIGFGYIVDFDNGDLNAHHGRRSTAGQLFDGRVKAATTVILRPPYDERELDAAVKPQLNRACRRGDTIRSAENPAAISSEAIVQAHLQRHTRDARPLALEAKAETSAVAALLLAEVHIRRSTQPDGSMSSDHLTDAMNVIDKAMSDGLLEGASLREIAYVRRTIEFVSTTLTTIAGDEISAWLAQEADQGRSGRTSPADQLRTACDRRVRFAKWASDAAEYLNDKGIEDGHVMVERAGEALRTAIRERFDVRRAYGDPTDRSLMDDMWRFDQTLEHDMNRELPALRGARGHDGPATTERLLV
jgi:alpha-glucosidase